MVYTKVVTDKSPWLMEAQLGGVYTNPASTEKDALLADKEWLDRLFANGQVATQYCDPEGNISMNEEWNVNGSYCCYRRNSQVRTDVFSGKWLIQNAGMIQWPLIYTGEQDMKIFESGVKYFR